MPGEVNSRGQRVKTNKKTKDRRKSPSPTGKMEFTGKAPSVPEMAEVKI